MHRCYDCGGGGPFTKNQKRKGQLRSCQDCLGNGATYECRHCNKRFRDRNALTQHEHTHRAKDFPCPGCSKMYRGLTDTIMHFESGSCAACRGAPEAQRAAYNLVKSQPGGDRFLTGTKLLTMNNGDLELGGYREDADNYYCPTCGKTFGMLSALTQHQANRLQCMAGGMQPNLQIGYTQPASMVKKFYHGTRWTHAHRILQDGFLPSEDGCLGRGIYVAQEDKARRFAEMRADDEEEDVGGIVEVLVTIRNPKYVVGNDRWWQDEGYDACRANRTTASTNMEWCIKDDRQIEVLQVIPAWVS